MLCQLDMTASDAHMKKVYTLSKLDRHLKSSCHSRKEQLIRAFQQEKQDYGDVRCELCPARPAISNVKAWLKHLQENHPDQLNEPRSSVAGPGAAGAS